MHATSVAPADSAVPAGTRQHSRHPRFHPPHGLARHAGDVIAP
ncbi:hypothetical protein [Streptomyces murinus]|nr:hypothetical protein [Streptomyces murinus]